jgi:multidrug efflux system membrane fusion protein
VQTAKVTQKDTPIWLETVGNVLANLNVSVTPQVGGQVESVYVKEGQHVKAGDLLYVIDPRPYEALVAQAQGTLIADQANLAYQKKLYERNSQLVKDDYISKINLEQIESAVLQAQGAVEKDEGALAQAKINLDWCYIRSPIDGKISYYNIDVGNIVSANDTNALTVIRQISPIQVQFTYTQREFEEIQRHFGTAKSFEFEVALLENEELTIPGDVYFFDNNINTNTGTILLKGRVPNLDEKLWPGEFVRVGMLLKTQPNAVLIPIEAIDRTQEGYFTFVVNQNSVAELRKLDLGRQVAEFYIVNCGVKPDEQVITIGQLNVRNGMQVTVDQTVDKTAENKFKWQLRR